MINNHIIYNNNCCFGPYLCVYVCRMYVRQCYDAVGWAAGRASGQWWGAGVVICLERGADLHMFQLMPLPLTVSCFSKIQTGFAFLVPAHLGSPRKMAVKRVCVYVRPLVVFIVGVCVTRDVTPRSLQTRINRSSCLLVYRHVGAK